MSEYSPKYDTSIKSRTVRSYIDTQHTDCIDWDFPFDDLEFVSCRCLDEDGKKKELTRQKHRLRVCEDNIGDVDYYGKFGGCYEVLAVGMCSRWPFWRPRPYVLVERTFLSSVSQEWVGWLDLPKIKIKDTPQ